MNESFCDWTQLVTSLAVQIDEQLDKDIEAKAKERVDAKQKEIDKLTHELNTARFELDFWRKDSLRLTRLNSQLTEGNSQLFATMLNLSKENDWLTRPLWVKIVGWFAR